MQNMVTAVRAAKKLLSNGDTVTAHGWGDHPLTSFRVTNLRQEEGFYYGKALNDCMWYPIKSLYGPTGEEL